MATGSAADDPPDPEGPPMCKCTLRSHEDKFFMVSTADLLSRKDIASFFKLDPSTVKVNSRLILTDAPVTVALLEEDGQLMVDGEPQPMPLQVRVAIVRGVTTVITGVAMAAAVAYLGKALGKGIGTTGTALGRGIGRTGTALGRGLGLTGVALGQGIADLGTSVKDGVKDINVGVRVGVGGNDDKKEEEKPAESSSK